MSENRKRGDDVKLNPAEQIAMQKFSAEDQELLQDLLAQKHQAPYIRFKQQFGRPSKLDDELIERFIAALLSCSYVETACQFCGLTRQTYYRWIEKAAKYVIELEKVYAKQEKAVHEGKQYRLSPLEKSLIKETMNANTERLIYFYYRVQQAQSELEITLQRRILTASANSWSAAAWILERKFSTRWMAKDARDIVDPESENKTGFAYVEVPADPNEGVVDVTPNPSLEALIDPKDENGNRIAEQHWSVRKKGWNTVKAAQPHKDNPRSVGKVVRRGFSKTGFVPKSRKT